MIAEPALGILVGIMCENQNRVDTINEMKLQKPLCHRFASTMGVWLSVVHSISLSV